MAILKTLSVAYAGAAYIIWGIQETTAAAFSTAPLFNDVASYSTTISANNDLTDIYFPNLLTLKNNIYSLLLVKDDPKYVLVVKRAKRAGVRGEGEPYAIEH